MNSATITKTAINNAVEIQTAVQRNISRYETESFLLEGTILPWDNSYGKERGTCPHPKTKIRSAFRQFLIETSDGTATAVIFEDQGESIWQLNQLPDGEQFAAIVATYTSKSGWFANTHRVWRYTGAAAVGQASAASAVNQAVASSTLARATSLGVPTSAPNLAAMMGAIILANSDESFKRCLNSIEAYAGVRR